MSRRPGLTMPLVRDRNHRRLHAESRLMGEGLVSHSFLASLEETAPMRLFPDVDVVKIGGQSICDRGAKALPALVREIVAVKQGHKLLLATGGAPAAVTSTPSASSSACPPA